MTATATHSMPVLDVSKPRQDKESNEFVKQTKEQQDEQ